MGHFVRTIITGSFSEAFILREKRVIIFESGGHSVRAGHSERLSLLFLRNGVR